MIDIWHPYVVKSYCYSSYQVI